MRFILDTHVLLWAITDEGELPPRARDLLIDPANEFVFSVASLWEIAIKFARNRGRSDDMPIDAAAAARLAYDAGFDPLTVTELHAVAVGDLPVVRHADPFDRLLVAQAIAEPMHLLTADKALAAYGDRVMLV